MFAKKPAFLFSVLCASSLLLSSCEGQKPAATTAPAATAAPAPATDAPAAAETRYECPMGWASSRSTTPGKRPTCEMELEKKS